MHASKTLDAVFVVSGSLELIVEKGSTLLHAGDSVIQQGTKHSWRVIGDEPVTFAGVLISGEEVIVLRTKHTSAESESLWAESNASGDKSIVERILADDSSESIPRADRRGGGSGAQRSAELS